jgi:hypothetical protein
VTAAEQKLSSTNMNLVVRAPCRKLETTVDHQVVAAAACVKVLIWRH